MLQNHIMDSNDILNEYYYNDNSYDIQVPSIVNDYTNQHPVLVDRYYTKYYYSHPKDVGKDEFHQVLFHSNRVCLVGLSPNHIAIKKGIAEITFDIGNLDRSTNQVTGKGKKGGMLLQPDSALAIITCTDNTKYKIFACIPGKLLEVNTRLIKNPDLIGTEGNGYIGIMLPKPEQCDKIKTSLITQETYSAIKHE